VRPTPPLGGRHRLASRLVPLAAMAAAFGLVVAEAPSTSHPAAAYRAPSGRPPAPAPGPARGRPNCSRRAVLGPAFSCEPAWSGDNGGATYRGVTASQVTLDYYLPSLGGSLGSVAALAGASPPAVQDQEVSTYARFFNRYFQTYGRRVVVKVFRSGQPAGDEAGARSDAVAVATQDRAFLVTGAVDASFLDEAARRGVETVTGAQLPQPFLSAHFPFLWGLLASTDTEDAMIAEYVDKRLGPGSPARFGGQHSRPPVNGRPRRIGLVYPTTNPDGSPSIQAGVGDDLARRLRADGLPVGAEVGYSQVPSDAQAQATNIVARLRAARVTTVACLCDPFAPLYLTRAATSQGWYPEWLVTGYGLQDADQLARLYDQSQWRHAFGITTLPSAAPTPTTAPYKAWEQANPGRPLPVDAPLVFAQLLVPFAAIEAAGPRLDPSSFARAMFSLYLPTNPLFYYSRSDLGGIKDAAEVWWDPTALGPDGKAGHYEEPDGARRYRLGHWPARPTTAFQAACLPPGSCGAGA
jgi:hypothetical protein